MQLTSLRKIRTRNIILYLLLSVRVFRAFIRGFALSNLLTMGWPDYAMAAAVQFLVSRRQSEQTKAVAGWSAVTGTEEPGTTASTNGWIAGSNFTVGERYLILVWGYHNTSNTNANSGIRVTHGGTSFTESEGTEESDRNGAAYKTPYFWFTVWTAANEDVEVEYYDNSTSTSRVEDVTLLAINVETLIADGDLVYDVQTAGGALTTTPVAKAGITWTPANNGDSWWIMSYSRGDIQSLTSDAFEAQLNLDAGTVVSAQQVDGEDTNDSPVYGIGWATTLTNALHSADIELSESNNNQGWFAAGVFALRLNVFDDFVINSTAGAQVLNAGTNNYLEISGVTKAIGAGYWLATGGFIATDNGGRTTARIQTSTTDITDEDGGWSAATTDLVPWTGGDVGFYSNIVDVAWNLDARETLDVTPDPSADNAWIAAFMLRPRRIISTVSE